MTHSITLISFRLYRSLCKGSHCIVYMIQPLSFIRCGTKYFEYPIVTDVYLGDASNVSESFPTITICLNSMHSRQKIEQFHHNDDKLVSALRTGSGVYHRGVYSACSKTRLKFLLWFLF